MGCIAIPAWCQFLALTHFTFRSKTIRFGLLVGLVMMVAAIWVAAHFGSSASGEAVIWMGAIGLILLCLPIIKAGEMELKLGALGVLPEFMATLFSDQPFPKWLASKFGKTDTENI